MGGSVVEGGGRGGEKGLVDVALPVPLARPFTYALPAGVEAPAGVRVRVAFGRQRLVGVVLGPARAAVAAGVRVRAVEAVLDAAPTLTGEQLALAQWVADYYYAPVGEAVALLLPPRMADGEAAPETQVAKTVRYLGPPPATARLGSKMAAIVAWLADKGQASLETLRAATGASADSLRRLAAHGVLAVDEVAAHRDPLRGVNLANLGTHTGDALSLNAEQAAAVATIGAAFGSFRGFLLHGVTGSGKTEVYLTLIGQALAAGRGIVLVVPEIALTPQLMARFRSRLGDLVAVQHSGLDPAARHEQWLRIRAGELPVVIGARSAIFAPVPRLGLILVDEEHDPSFKQETSPRYHGRDLALYRGHLAGVPVVLGSATPSIETWANVARGKLTRVALTTRATNADRPMPEVSVLDMRGRVTVDGEGLFSRDLFEGLKACVEAGEQALLFVNRRGYAASLQCRACGTALACDHCSVTYTWHRREGRLVCHYCDAKRRLPAACPSCGHQELAEIGFGTEQVEGVLSQLLPAARLGRMDRDTTRGAALIKLLTRFRRHELDVLVGTQMLAKGHDFPKVTLVGVLLAEQGLAFPDFRSGERTFHLLTQIAGRAGRGERPGRVLLQTRQPDHPVIRFATGHDAIGFLDAEVGLRELRGFPPASALALFRISGRDEAAVAVAAGLVHAALGQHAGDGVVVHPAQPAPIARIQDRHRFQVLARGRTRGALRRTLDGARHVWDDGKRFPGVQIALDIDPHNFL
jgi:primosomal protein N' (replication factor Y)